MAGESLTPGIALVEQSMSFPIPRTTRGRRLLAATFCAAVAFVAALSSIAQVSVLPPGVHGMRTVQVAAASTHVLVDHPRSLIGDTRSETGHFDALSARTVLLGELMASREVREHIGRRAGVPPGQIAAATHVTANVQAVMTEPDLERRADQIVHSTAPYRIDIQPRPNLPELDIYTQAPTAAAAVRLADAAVQGLRDHLTAVGARPGEANDQVDLQQLGTAHGGVVNSGARIQIAGFTFFVVLFVSAGALGIVARLRRGFLAAGGPPAGGGHAAGDRPAPPPPSEAPPLLQPRWRTFPPPRTLLSRSLAVPVQGPIGLVDFPAVAGAAAPARAITGRRLRIVTAAGDWPRTTRLLPWSLAVFMAIVWLVPFNTIQLSASVPIDLKFDRLVLPGVVALWIVAVAVGGPAAPRLRVSLIHVALGAIVATACLSLVLDAGYLNRTLELEQGIKKLTLLVSYVSVFLILASVVRPTEVPSFLKYTLVLACLCAAGTIWEYRFHYNVFYDLPARFLPGVFTVGAPESSAVDEIGRRLVRGPAEIPLEMVAMIAMALPIALVGLLQTTERRGRILYGLATCLLLAAAVSTYRKSAFLAPLAVILTLAFFLRGRLLRLAPVGVLGLAAIHVLSPGAFGSIAVQLNANRLGVTTVSDRTSDYDAVRADLWSHMAFGRGFGTYDHLSYRILDMELLHQLMEVGIVGLIAYVSLAVAIVIVARRLIHGPHPSATSVGLIAAAAAMAFLVVSSLFDVMSFPHCPYILLFLAGFLAVTAIGPADTATGPAGRS
jgi:hypothetical protein